MSRRALSVAVALPLAAAVSAPANAGNHAGTAGAGRAAEVYHVDLDALNDSGVEGKAVLVLRDGTLRVHLHARGLVPAMLHPQHVHGFATAEATCPPDSAAGDDDVLSFAEGLPFYGPVVLGLAPFPTADKGKISYHETFDVEGDLLDLSDEVVIVHGGFVDGEYVPSLPVACGELD